MWRLQTPLDLASQVDLAGQELEERFGWQGECRSRARE